MQKVPRADPLREHAQLRAVRDRTIEGAERIAARASGAG
jgi:hypothetical protein